ncbi:MAG: hypothetical protein AABW56_01790 [Nanoarchaeota archaeon]
MEENIETRVGYKTISILRDILSEYIGAHTIDGEYKGDSHYLYCYFKFNSFLED